ncbi:hypothetical protein CRG98_007674 [Punica granatum]|uniref:Phytochelatin synthase C-terminal domain-containing protein n=1 Tax=Punica granatum TaxID=22663 RepID=A0A2I0KVN1_PUNGR|nr:hypothetical protein CRG98_007674 [Punica granatum]
MQIVLVPVLSVLSLIWLTKYANAKKSLQSCKNESWIGIAKYLMDDIPRLLKSEHVKDIRRLIGVICESLPPDFEKYIHWIVEVRRAEDAGTNKCREEKGRLDVMDEVLKQVQETDLHQDVLEFLLSSSCCTRLPSSFNEEENLQKFVSSIRCKCAEILAGNIGCSGCSHCGETENCTKCISADDNNNNATTVLRETVAYGQNEEKVEMLIPFSQVKVEHRDSNDLGGNACIKLQPAGSNILTVLLLALPPETWSRVKNPELQQEMYGIFSTENLPPLLQEEVLHLRRQLYLLKKCQENNVVEDLSSPSV